MPYQHAFITSPISEIMIRQNGKISIRASHGGVHSAHGDPLGSVPGLGLFFALNENRNQRVEETLV
jgi:hypothetical protein